MYFEEFFNVYITRLQFPKISVAKPKKTMCNFLAIAYQVGQKNRNWFRLGLFLA